MLPRHPKEIAAILSSKVGVRPLPAQERAEEGARETGLQHVSSADWINLSTLIRFVWTTGSYGIINHLSLYTLYVML